MKKIQITDITLRAFSSLRESELTFREKLEIARSLDRLKVDAVELAPLTGRKEDVLSNKTIASIVSRTLSASMETDSDPDDTWNSIKDAKKPRINLLAPVSPVGMEYTAHLKAPAMLEKIKEKISQASVLCPSVEFSAVDATRAEREFLYEAIRTAVKAGAGIVTVCDTAGIMLPSEFSSFVSDIKKNVSELSGCQLYVQISDQMNTAAACAVSALGNGVDGIKCTSVSCGYPTLEQITSFIRLRGADLGYSSDIRTTELGRTAGQIHWMLHSQKDSSRPLESTGHEETDSISLTSEDRIGDVSRVIRKMGYDLSPDDLKKVYEAFMRVAVKKSFVGTRELDAIVASTAMQVPSAYKIVNYVINSGNVITATANILLSKDGREMRGVGVGDGPIDAAFIAIGEIIGHHYELDDFQIQTVTEGTDAMGSALVKLRANGKVYSGNGISTDIIGASIRAYVSALNKIVYEEG